MPLDLAISRIRSSGIIAIVRGRFSTERMLAIADAMIDAGIGAMEVTLNSDCALEHIATLHARGDERLMIGAGTVRTPEDVDRAIDAGAQFLISPGFDEASVARATEAKVLHLPGVFTPTEAMHAAAAGCRLLKLFPCDVVGPAYLKALKAPLDEVDFVPTGGVSPANLAQWRRAGAVAVAAGSSLVSGPDQPLDELLARSRTMKQAWENARV